MSWQDSVQAVGTVGGVLIAGGLGWVEWRSHRERTALRDYLEIIPRLPPDAPEIDQLEQIARELTARVVRQERRRLDRNWWTILGGVLGVVGFPLTLLANWVLPGWVLFPGAVALAISAGTGAVVMVKEWRAESARHAEIEDVIERSREVIDELTTLTGNMQDHLAQAREVAERRAKPTPSDGPPPGPVA